MDLIKSSRYAAAEATKKSAKGWAAIAVLFLVAIVASAALSDVRSEAPAYGKVERREDR